MSGTTTTQEKTRARPFRPPLSSRNGNGNGTRPHATLTFSPAFQTRTLRFCIEHPEEWLPHLKSMYFDNPLEGQVFKIAKAMPPESVSLRTVYEAAARELGRSAAQRVARELLKAKLTDADRAYLTTELPKFIRFQRMGEVFIDASKAYQAQDMAGLERVWERGHLPLPGADDHLALARIADVKMERVQWKWKDHLAAGMLHLIAGEPGHGKSAVVLDLAARISRGDYWPDGARGTSTHEIVVIISAEDTAAHTIKPRLLAAGANLDKIHVQDVTTSGVRSLLPEDLPALERLLQKTQASVLIIDSVNDFLPNLDTYRINETKTILGAWHSLAARLGITVIGITHLSKANDRTTAQRLIGSVAFLAQTRLAFLVAPDDEDVSRLRRLFVALKNNLGPKARPLAFTMASTPVRADGVKTEAPRITWFPVHRRVDPDEIFRNLQRAVRPLVIATNVLNHELQQGPVLQRIVVAALAAANVPLRTARRAKKKLKIESIQRARKWYWMLPGWTEAQIAAWSPGPQGATQKATPRNGHLTT